MQIKENSNLVASRKFSSCFIVYFPRIYKGTKKAKRNNILKLLTEAKTKAFWQLKSTIYMRCEVNEELFGLFMVLSNLLKNINFFLRDSTSISGDMLKI